MDLIERLQAALAGKPRGIRSADGGKALVEVVAADIVAACDLVAEKGEPDGIVRALRKGSAAGRNLERKVVIQADDLYHLLDKAK